MKKYFSIFIFCFSYIFAANENPEAHLEDSSFSEEEVAVLEPSLITQPTPFPATLPKEIEIPSPKLLPQRKKNVFVAVSLSSLIPGLGHTYLGDLKTAGSLFGSCGLGFGSGVLGLALGNETLSYSSFVTFQSTSFYSVYAAYRDARVYNQQSGYSYKMPTDSFSDLSFAPFSLSVLKKPEVWGGFLGALALGAVVSYFGYHKKEAHIQCDFSSERLRPLVAFPVGIGEEAFFRGYMQSMFSEVFSPWGGIVLSSLVFGAVHIPNALHLEPEDQWRYYAFSLPLITTLGTYFGWLTYKNQSLKESVALHSWYDFTIFLISSSLTQSAAIGKPRVGISIAF